MSCLNYFLNRSSILPIHPVANPLGVGARLPPFHHRDGGENEVACAAVHALVLRADGQLSLGRDTRGDGCERLIGRKCMIEMDTIFFIFNIL